VSNPPSLEPALRRRPPPPGVGATLRRLAADLRTIGPGLITGASDDDPSGIGTFAQVGSQLGYAVLWLAAFTYPLVLATQELCARVAIRTGVGLGVSLRRRFPRRAVEVAVLALFVANTINLGADLEAVATGGQLLTKGALPAAWLVLPIAVGLLAFQLWLRYETIFRTLRWLTLALLSYVAVLLLVHPDLRTLLLASFVPTVRLSGTFVLAIVAILGTTISPYLFFWQASSEVDESRRAGRRPGRKLAPGVEQLHLRRMRTDVVVGMALSSLVMWAILATAAAELHGRAGSGILTAAQAASALAPVAGPYATGLFAFGIIGSGLLAIPVLSGSAAYAVKEVVGFRGSLDDVPTRHSRLYLTLGVATALGVGMSLLPIDPIAALFYSAVVNGIVAPPLLWMIVVLGSDRSVMGPSTSGRVSRMVTYGTVVAMSGGVVAWLALLAWGVVGH
jgi:NRAMP (natural resistance-associated macrophage protein)-like metal ion transporter